MKYLIVYDTSTETVRRTFNTQAGLVAYLADLSAEPTFDRAFLSVFGLQELDFETVMA